MGRWIVVIILAFQAERIFGRGEKARQIPARGAFVQPLGRKIGILWARTDEITAEQIDEMALATRLADELVLEDEGTDWRPPSFYLTYNVVAGAFIGGWLLSALGIFVLGGIVGSIVSATAGAVVLLLILRVLRRA